MHANTETAQSDMPGPSIRGAQIPTPPKHATELIHLMCSQSQPPGCHLIRVQNIAESKRRVFTLETEEINKKNFLKFLQNRLRMQTTT